MRVNTNLWNKIRYTILSPIYDAAASPFAKSRGRSIEQLDIQPGEKVLIIGADSNPVWVTEISSLKLHHLPIQGTVYSLEVLIVGTFEKSFGKYLRPFHRSGFTNE